MRFAATLILASILATAPAAAKPPQVLPDQMFGNLYALTQASSVLKVCADSDAGRSLPARKKQLLQRLQGGIDELVRKIALKFDDDVFGFYARERDDTARDPEFIRIYLTQYGQCGDTMFERMQWYVYDSQQKLDHFLSELPDAN
tara:strand:- start:271 stop:705 length:435 start_codon:yes stop_codon:yes gene_type:complete